MCLRIVLHAKVTTSVAEQQLTIVLTLKVKYCFMVYICYSPLFNTLQLQMSLRHLLVVQAVLSLAQYHEQASAK